jgi:hypothetical protein
VRGRVAVRGLMHIARVRGARSSVEGCGDCWALQRQLGEAGVLRRVEAWSSAPARFGEQRTSTEERSTATAARSTVRPTLLQKHARRASPGTAPTNCGAETET